MTTYTCNQRVKKGGKFYTVDAPIDLTEAELATLPPGAVTPVALGVEPDATDWDPDLVDAVNGLTKEAFKKDGGVRASTLRELSEKLGYEVSEETVVAIAEELADF